MNVIFFDMLYAPKCINLSTCSLSSFKIHLYIYKYKIRLYIYILASSFKIYIISPK